MFGDSGLVAERFGSNVRRLRRRADLSQEMLARRAELHRTEIGLLERGIRLPRLDTIVKVAGGLEIEAGALFDGLEWIPGSNVPGAFSAPPQPKVPQRRGRGTDG
jgi:transcriptional regulator with XRE-family HTH domain